MLGVGSGLTVSMVAATAEQPETPSVTVTEYVLEVLTEILLAVELVDQT
jgi:hypothetical protein